MSDTPRITNIDPARTPLLQGELRVTWTPKLERRMVMWAKRLFGIRHWLGTDTAPLTEATPGPGTGGTDDAEPESGTGAPGRRDQG